MAERATARPRAGIPRIAHAVRAGRASAADRIEAAIATADAHDAAYGVYITRCDASARAAAGSVDRSSGRGALALAGVTIAVKDLIGTRDAPTTAQSLVHESPWFGGRDAIAVARLRAAGALVTGKTSMAEHALGRIDPRRPFPVPRNPWDPLRWPGGSSSGSAIAVALGLADAALGTDTTGSLRIPAAFCGITGLRPTRGLVPLGGCVPASASLDAIGPMSRDARGCEALLRIIADRELAPPAWRDDLSGVRIGVPWTRLDAWHDRISPGGRAAFGRTISGLASFGARIVPFDLPEWDALTTATLTVAMSEVFARHAARFRERWHDYGRPFRRIAVLGGLLPPARVAAAHAAAAAARASLCERMRAVDAVALPTWPAPPPRYGDGVDVRADELNLTAPWSSTGLPVVATPMGPGDAGLPASLQLVGAAGDDVRLLEIADVVERAVTPLPPLRISRGPFPPVPDPDAGHMPSSETDAGVRARRLLESLGIVPDPFDIAAVAGFIDRGLVPDGDGPAGES